MRVKRVSITKRVAAFTGLTVAITVLLLVLLHFFQCFKIPLVSLVRWEILEDAFARDARLHILTVDLWAGVGLAWQHLGNVAVNSQIHRDVINTLEAIGRLAAGHVLEYKVVELMHQDALLVLVGERSEELRVIHQFKLGRLRVDAHASGRDSGRCNLVNTTRQGSEERLTHKQASSVHVQVEWLVSVVGHCSLSLHI